VESIRVMVVDDHPIVRQGLVPRCSGTADDLDVVGAAGSAHEAWRFVPRLAPDVVLLDLEMPELDGVEAISTIVSPRVRHGGSLYLRPMTPTTGCLVQSRGARFIC